MPDLEFAAQGEKTWSNVFAEAAIARGKRDPDLHVITAAMPDNTGVTKFQKHFPERTHDVGICEQHARGVRLGASQGREAARSCAIFSTFLQRAFDQIFQEVALNKVPVVFCARPRGHRRRRRRHAQRAASTSRTCARSRGSISLSARDETEFRAMLDLALDCGLPVAIRYPRTFAPHPAKELPVRRELVRGRSETLRTGGDVALVALGHMVYPVMEAAEQLAAQGIEATVVNARFVRPLDLDAMRDLTERFSAVFTIEEHSIRGGFSAQVLEELALVGGRADRIRPIAIPDAFVPHGIALRAPPRAAPRPGRPRGAGPRSSRRRPGRRPTQPRGRSARVP